MAASQETIKQILKVFKRYVPKEVQGQMLDDLVKVEGNKSFTTTVAFLRVAWATEKAGGEVE